MLYSLTLSPPMASLTPSLSHWERVTKGRVRGAVGWERDEVRGECP